MAGILYLLLAVVLLVGLYINLVGAPGLWVMVLGTLGYAWATHGAYAGLRTIIAIAVLAGLAELVEFMAAGAAAKRAGASKRGIWGALIGGILGAFFLTVAVPVIGTIIGVCTGTFLGAIVGELLGGTELGGSMRVGAGAVWGRLLGTLAKLLFGCVILGIVLWTALPFHLRHARKPVLPNTTTRPVARGASGMLRTDGLAHPRRASNSRAVQLQSRCDFPLAVSRSRLQ